MTVRELIYKWEKRRNKLMQSVKATDRILISSLEIALILARRELEDDDYEEKPKTEMDLVGNIKVLLQQHTSGVTAIRLGFQMGENTIVIMRELERGIDEGWCKKQGSTYYYKEGASSASTSEG